MSEINKTKKVYYALFLVCIFVFSIIINLFITRGYDFSYLCIYPQDIDVINYDTDVYDFIYVFIKRIKQFFAVFLLMKVINPMLIYNFILILMSFFVGIMLTIQTYYYGFSGVIILLIHTLPHYIVYILMLKKMYEFSCIKRSNEYWVRYIIIIILFLLIGTLCETFFLNIFLNKYYQYMVSG